MTARRVSSCLVMIALVLTGCTGGEHQDLKLWMIEQTKTMKGKVPPLPEITAFPVVAYEAETLLSPFAAGKIITGEAVIDRTSPDQNRLPQPLEAFALDDLKIIGIILNGDVPYALVQTPPPNKPKYVRVGEYMGKSFGKITAITLDGVKVVETVRDNNGAWVPQERVLLVPREGGSR